ncbi:MAG: glycosyltransferase, partial [Candidatus Krumholzibacteria bacterium]|nr:glycosyltransferase [Candidatus Krumholzibacteria bacterium]
MKILMVQTFHYRRGGDSTYMLALTGLLEEHGHEVVHFAMKHPENLPSPWEDRFAERIDFPSLLARRTPAAAWKVLSRGIWNSDARRRIAALADETRPDVAHLHNIHGHLTTSILGPLNRRKIPVV